jgi:hypothetical protein
MARRALKPLDALDVLEREAEERLERLELAEALGLLAERDRRDYLREVDPETVLYDDDVWH